MNDNNLGFPYKSDPNEQTSPQQPIRLSAPPEQQPYAQPQQPPPSGQWIPPQGIENRPLSTNPAVGRNRSWKNDPVYRILLIAIVVVVLSSLACVTVLAATFNQPSSQTAQGGGPNPQQTANARGLNVGSLTPTVAPTPTPTPTAEPTPTPTPTPTATVVTQLTVDINNLPKTVQGGNTVSFDVHTNEAGVTVQVTITYFALHNQTSGTQTTDENGDATFAWDVPTFRTDVNALVTVEARDSQDHQASKNVTVKITSG